MRELERVFSEPGFEGAINPNGAASFRRHRQFGSAAAVAESDSLRAVLRASGVWAYSAEGSMYYDLSLSTLVERSAPFISTAMRAYLEMDAVEQARPSASDGSFMVPRDVVIERIVAAEQFLDRFPQASQAREVAHNRNRYVTWLLYPSVNFGGFSAGRVLEADARRAMERLATERASYPSGRAAVEMLDLLRANGYRRSPAVDSMISRKWRELHDQGVQARRQ